uniref:Vacuolar protein sorting 13 homolog A n=1 Tax=Oreochromis niloticus TaxID=8128 RepID=A0A669EIP5_ORENI
MVFESVVVDVLNRFLGDYVVNLDSSQLKLGIWGGDAVLNNLEIKENALSQLDIPFKVKAGHIGRLQLKIPWKYLYTQSVEATLDGVYLLIVPTASIKYDAEKEEKQLQEARQRELQRIEQTKLKAAEQENPKLEKQDTFVEKLVTQVIKNLQVKISNIHVRYEDHVIFRPISADAKLRMNPRSDVDFSSPKMDLMVNLREVAIELNKAQYISILELLCSVDMMSRNLPYRKYRPEVHVHKNAKTWWKYVITGVLEIDVKPGLHMWSWQHIRRHRQMVKNYRELYKIKITSKKPSDELLKKLEKTLDIFNITLARQQAEVEPVILAFLTPPMSVPFILLTISVSGFDELLTPAEKAKLYTAIGYSETAANPNLPKDYCVTLSLYSLYDKDKNEIIRLTVGELYSTLTQRPGAQAIKITAKLTLFEVTGLTNKQPPPTLLSSSKAAIGAGTPLLSILFETNPLDESANQRLHVESQPLEIIYDAITVNSISAFFRPPDDMQLDELTNATLMKLEQFRDRTATGLLYVIETQKVLDLKVNLMASYVIIPQTGFYNGTQNILLLDLGHFKVGNSSNIEDIMSRAYDSFDVQLENGNWKKARKQKRSPLHILEPVDLKVVFSRAMVNKDSRMPKYKMSGELPLLSLRISDVKLRSVLELVDSIPLPESKPAARGNAPSSTPKVRSEGYGDGPLRISIKSLKTRILGVWKVVHISCKQIKPSVTVLHLDIEGLGTELKLRTFDMTSNTYLREICLKCPEYMDSEDKQVQLITTLDNKEVDLLTLEYIKADKNGPDFKSQYNNTEQLIKVTFSSLDVHLHTEALLNTMNFLTDISQLMKLIFRAVSKVKCYTGNSFPFLQLLSGNVFISCPSPFFFPASKRSKFADVVNLHIKTDLRCLKVFIRGQKARISEISIEGMKGRVFCVLGILAVLSIGFVKCLLFLQYSTVYRAVSIADKEVFHFHMINYTDATEGDAYLDMSNVDTTVTLSVGCIQVIFLNKFLSSILVRITFLGRINLLLLSIFEFVNNFQEAKEALTEVTVQAAEKAASGVKELAERTTRIALDVHFNAPVIFLPQSSSSSNVIVADLGLLSIKNRFAKQPCKSDASIPPVVDIMTVRLTDLKMYRSVSVGEEIQLLKPVSLDLEIRRNLSSSWYHEIPDIAIEVHLKPMSVSIYIHISYLFGNTVVTAAVVETQKNSKLKKNTLKLNFKFDSLTVVLYSSNEDKRSDPHDEQLKLAEFTLGTISTSVHMYSDSSMMASVKLAECLLDDKRPKVKSITPRMMAMCPGAEQNNMVEVSYRQTRESTTLDTVVQDVYLCASMEFLLTVADIFLKATQQGFAQVSQPKNITSKESAPAPATVTKTEMKVLVRNPEIVFVADLTRDDAPALVMTTYCELVMKNGAEGSQMTADLIDLAAVAACHVFFTLRARLMQVTLSFITHVSHAQVSPVIINTVITIQSALTPTAETPEKLDSPVPVNLWDKQSWKELKLWFLEEEDDEDTKSVNISSICVTLEAGVGHRTIPMLLAKSSFKGDVKNWSTLINLYSQLTLEVHYYNEVMGVWEPLLEPLEDETRDGFRPWVLELKMKKKPVKYTSMSDEVDSSIPDYKTVIAICSKDQLNITLSKCGLAMLSNLGTAFAEAAKQTAECFQKDEAPFVVKNRLGLPVSVRHSEMFCPVGQQSIANTVKLQNENTCTFYFLFPAPDGHTSASVIPLIKVGRGMYSVMHNNSGVTRFLVCQISSVEGSKYIKIRSPFQVCWMIIPIICISSRVITVKITFIVFQSLREDEDEDGDAVERKRAELDIAVHVKYDLGQMVVAIHSPYWMINKTGRLLQYKADDIHRKHPMDYKMPLLFSFKPRYFLRNNKVRLMISESELSDEFSLDTVGSHGDVKCKGRYKDYLVGVKIDASSFSLTRIVTFVPFYMLVNRTKHSVFICEEGQETWTEAKSEQVRACSDFSLSEQCRLRPWFWFEYILDSGSWVGGIIVDMNLSEHSATIQFSDYHDGAAPFLIINHTKNQTLHSQKKAEHEELEAGKAVYYTWTEPTGSRALSWKCSTYNGTLKSEEVLHMSLQRVVLFTEERRVFKMLCDNERVQLAQQEIVLALRHVGLSLVNNSTSQEVAFIGITSSDVVWEFKPKKKSRWKPLSIKEAEVMEDKFKDYIESGAVDKEIFDLENGFQVKYYNHFYSIQNQLPGAIFPYVFYPVKLPKSVAMETEPKPLTDISIITRAAGHSDISRIKYFMVLIQEMDLKLDLGFLYAILDLFSPENDSITSAEQEVELFEKDITNIKTELNHVSAADKSPISLYEYFHISPIKLHLSFSLSTGGEDGLKEKRDSELIPVQSLNLLLKSIGATLTDVQDVVFKLAFFELNYQFYTTQQLQSEVLRHYSKQAIKQMYVLVLGLDVLGNPFGLIRGLSEGVEAFFYEPYQGAIQGPEEFVEGMALGVKALVGGAVGGIAGAASRITGAMAKGVAAITMDEEYQQKRRETMNKQPSGLREGLTRGGKGLVSGFVSGITGIVTKPIKGAQKEGAAGFFKGVGKGLVGAVARPTGGIIDMASSTFQGIKRAAETSQDIQSLRPPRFIHEDGVIRPYKEREGLGSQMLQVRQKPLSIITFLQSFPFFTKMENSVNDITFMSFNLI